ncbi:MAG TPA: hypothetical protein DHV26_10865 [Cytophagales bacterium]|nr:hypothetical protein [Cytophagales bacterium]HRG11361.1 DUF86 domain-containing protein [Cyclobacteriaceae bacterium]
MSKKLQRLIIIDILDAIADVESFTEGQTYDQFTSDKKAQAAIVYKLIVIGEASNRLSKEYRDKYQQVEWSRIIRCRHILVHEYDMINLEIVWRILDIYLPELKKVLHEILQNSPDEF